MRNTLVRNVPTLPWESKEAHALCRNLADRPKDLCGRNDDVIKARASLWERVSSFWVNISYVSETKSCLDNDCLLAHTSALEMTQLSNVLITVHR